MQTTVIVNNTSVPSTTAQTVDWNAHYAYLYPNRTPDNTAALEKEIAALKEKNRLAELLAKANKDGIRVANRCDTYTPHSKRAMTLDDNAFEIFYAQRNDIIDTYNARMKEGWVPIGKKQTLTYENKVGTLIIEFAWEVNFWSPHVKEVRIQYKSYRQTFEYDIPIAGFAAYLNNLDWIKHARMQFAN